LTAAKRSASEIFEQRGARAALLAPQGDATREPLQFARVLSTAQARCAGQIEPLHLTGALSGDADAVVPLLSPVLRILSERSEEAKRRLDDDSATARTRLLVYWSGDSDDYIARALLQPYATVLRAHNIAADRVHTRGHCPFCGAAAWVASRKTQPEAESGFRFLHCSLCALEWGFNRICCPACFEENPYKLPQFQAEGHTNVRVEACETCRRYVKSIDMTLDARPVPIVDDLLSLSMDLWAVDEGFTRIEPGLAGL
jgi:formate dehydrogenase accessory protein FdhE